MTLSIIIATKNRAATLTGTLDSILRQTRSAEELLIVDQSSNLETNELVARFAQDLRIQHAAFPEIIYLHDTTLFGAAAARNVGIANARGDLLIFLDDDVLLEEDFFEQLVAPYETDPEIGGVQGIITNYSRPPLRSRLLETFFCLGPFRDERQPIYWNAESLRHTPPIRVRKFTSCLMSVKRSALGAHRFDADYNGRGEDIDLSWRVSERHPLVIAPAARARHLRTTLARPPENWHTSNLLACCYLYRRLWNKSIVHRLCFAWLKCGFALLAVASSIRMRSGAPCATYLAAVRSASAARYV